MCACGKEDFGRLKISFIGGGKDEDKLGEEAIKKLAMLAISLDGRIRSICA